MRYSFISSRIAGIKGQISGVGKELEKVGPSSKAGRNVK